METPLGSNDKTSGRPPKSIRSNAMIAKKVTGPSENQIRNQRSMGPPKVTNKFDRR